jgi:DNA-binding HxlR family transcriptional regulator
MSLADTPLPPPAEHDLALTEYEDACADRDGIGEAVRNVLSRIGDKWSLLIIVTLSNGRLRFSELQRHIPGISQRMLTRTLRHLERDGLLARTLYAEVPPRVEYELTHTGETLISPSIGLARWAIDHYPTIEKSRELYDRIGSDS